MHRTLPLRRAATTVAAAAASLLLVAACGRGEGGGDVKVTTNAPAATSVGSVPAAPAVAPIRPPGAPWHIIAQDVNTLVAVDTTEMTAQPDGDARVHILYVFAAPQAIPGRPGVVFRAIESKEVTECAKATSHPSTAILFDSAGKELARASSPPGPQGAGMIGSAGGPLCAYLRAQKKVR